MSRPSPALQHLKKRSNPIPQWLEVREVLEIHKQRISQRSNDSNAYQVKTQTLNPFSNGFTIHRHLSVDPPNTGDPPTPPSSNCFRSSLTGATGKKPGACGVSKELYNYTDYTATKCI